MSYRRVINRNGLAIGDYDHAERWAMRLNLTSPGLLKGGLDELLTKQQPAMVKRIEEYENAARMLLGDLRRLEADSVDESATCSAIGFRTKIDPEIVAAVLKEFIAW